ncbi:hypothetical protein [Microvirga splendida]|uniref:Uncharacterized protein n=1 Tax=Microvirga splendida TaxID=2795727 RepID=A0ABS0Y0A3_9HYPH|nr:hypothetical protein [Microvirga splendida]MBJ6125744.1 hypothetical protein [Microvirga splendida]
MAQALSYCTAKLFSHAILPLAMMKPQPVASANDDDPPASMGRQEAPRFAAASLRS